MKVGLFYPPYNDGNASVIRAFHSGIPNSSLSDDTRYRKCDVLVIFGLVKYSFKKSFAKGELMNSHDGPVIVVERGFIKRDKYWSIGFGGINGRANFVNANSLSDRWNKLGVELKPWRDPRGGVVLVSGQVPWDTSVQHMDHLGWCRETVNTVRQMGMEPILRPHPLAVKRNVDYDVDCEVSNKTLEEDLTRSDHVVTWCSNSGVDAVLEGVPTIAMDKMSMVWPVTGKTLLDLVDPFTPDRQQWANNIAYAQWSLDEMRSGEAWQHISRGIT